MYSYVDLFDFSEMTIVQALRKQLDNFRLPGEAQKVDRIMEKFASRYFECYNGGDEFTSADTLYTLSYSIIMLATDLHSVHVKKKMTKEEYIKLNRGINGAENLSNELLSNIYDDIAACELKMKPGSNKLPKFGTFLHIYWFNSFLDMVNSSYRQRKVHQTLELENIAQNAHALMEQATYVACEFNSATHFEHVVPMFAVSLECLNYLNLADLACLVTVLGVIQYWPTNIRRRVHLAQVFEWIQIWHTRRVFVPAKC